MGQNDVIYLMRHNDRNNKRNERNNDSNNRRKDLLLISNIRYQVSFCDTRLSTIFGRVRCFVEDKKRLKKEENMKNEVKKHEKSMNETVFDKANKSK